MLGKLAKDKATSFTLIGRGVLKRILLLVVACAAFLPAGSALAAEITILSVNGSWYDPVDNMPGSQAWRSGHYQRRPDIEHQLGHDVGNAEWLRLYRDHSAAIRSARTHPVLFNGRFQHRNFSVSPPSLVSVQLDVVIVMAVDGVPIAPLTFTYTINHEETPNNLDPCPYPTPPGEGCTDRVTIVASPDPTTFNVDGVDYTLDMSFLNNGSAVDEFITREGNTVNSTGLIGEFTLPPGLSATKTGPSTMYVGEWGQFTVAVQNQSEADAHNATILDILPDGATGGMCDTTPEILSARVFPSGWRYTRPRQRSPWSRVRTTR